MHKVLFIEKILFSVMTKNKIIFSQKKVLCMCYEKTRSNKSTSVEPAPYM